MKLIEHRSITKELELQEIVHFPPERVFAVYVGIKDLAVTVLFKDKELGVTSWFKTEKERDVCAAALLKKLNA